MLWVKAAGVTAVFICCCLLGVFKSEALRRRVELLEETVSGLHCLKEQIRFCGGELKNLLPRCFEKTASISFSANGVKVTGVWFNDEDVTILEELFKDLGSGDSISECNRIERTLSVLERQHSKAFEELSQKGKLWRCGGVCVGAAICILLV